MMQRVAMRRKQRRAEKKECPIHAFMAHGKEAEELRKGIDALCTKYSGRIEDEYEEANVADFVSDLRELLDDIDARDSLAYLERHDPKGGT